MARFRIRTRCIVPLQKQPHGRPQDDDVETYLGREGLQSPLEKAIQFRSQQAAERALMEEWNRLRNAGNKSVILSVVPSQ